MRYWVDYSLMLEQTYRMKVFNKALRDRIIVNLYSIFSHSLTELELRRESCAGTPQAPEMAWRPATSRSHDIDHGSHDFSLGEVTRTTTT